MAGEFKGSDSLKPGDKIVIFISEFSINSGIWEGELIEVIDKPYGKTCRAKITDPKAHGLTDLGQPLIGRELFGDYTVFDKTPGTDRLTLAYDHVVKEKRKIERQRAIEKATYEAMMKACLSAETLPKFEAMMDQFLTKLGK